MKKRYLLTICLFATMFIVRSQQLTRESIAVNDTVKNTTEVVIQPMSAAANDAGPALPVVIPPSPNAAALGMYGDIPVGHYTGIPNISIPLYEIEAGSIKLPIILSYHASGIKVAQEASWVGLGWALNVGGVISRTIRGWDDLQFGDVEGYSRKMNLPPHAPNNAMDFEAAKISHIKKEYDLCAENKIDTEPDVFYYNFGNYTGKMMFQKGDSTRLMLLNQDPISVQGGNGGWTVKTPDGFTWYFGSEGVTTIYTVLGGGIFQYREKQPSCVTEWYLDSIVSPQKDVIRFRYRADPTLFGSRISVSQNVRHPAIVKLLPKKNGIPDLVNDIFMDENMSYTVKSKFTTNGLVPERIEFNDGTVMFETQNHGLRKISVRNRAGEEIISYLFNTSYFRVGANDTDPDRIRLKLDGIEDGSGKKYTFMYHSESLPEKTSQSVDHWGYYNGFNNGMLGYQAPTPSVRLDGTGMSQYDPMYIPGANREPTEKAKACILTKITYPTGGYVGFDYELNDFSNFASEKYFNTGIVSTDGDLIDLSSADKTVGTMSIKLSYTGSCPYVDCVTDPEDPRCNRTYGVLERQENNGTWTTFKQFENHNIGCESFQNNQCVMTETIELPRGKYRMRNGTWNDLQMSFMLHYMYERPANFVHQGGGLRVKQITRYDGKNTETIRYDYVSEQNPNISSGKLMTFPKYHYLMSNLRNNFIEMPDGYTFDIRGGCYYEISAESIAPLGTSAGGYFVGYDRVVETKTRSLQNNGKTIYHFLNSSSGSPSIYAFPGIPEPMNNDNGLLKKTEYRDSTDLLIKEESYRYARMASLDIVKGLILKTLPPAWFRHPTTGEPIPWATPIFTVRFYDTLIERWNKIEDKTITYDYSNSPKKTFTQINRYEYGNPVHKMVTKQVSSTSDNDSVTTVFKYPQDVAYTAGTEIETARRQLVDDWNIHTPVEQSRTKSGKIITTATEYKRYPDCVVPATIKTNTGPGQAVENRVRYHGYDRYGNPAGVSYEGGPKIGYQWGYNGRYPTVKTENVEGTETATTRMKEKFITSPGGGEKTYEFEHDGGTVKYMYFANAFNPLSIRCEIHNVTTGVKVVDRTINSGVQLSADLSAGRYKVSFKSGLPYTVKFEHPVHYNNYVNRFFYEGFEDQTPPSSPEPYAGLSCRSGSYAVPFVKPNDGKKYHVNYRKYEGGKWVSATSEYNNNMTLSGTAIDEVRVYPEDALMSTYTYKPLVGLTSETDPSGRTLFYEYDAAGRLIRVRDEDGKILKEHEYRYAQQ